MSEDEIQKFLKNSKPSFKCPYANGGRYISKWSQRSMNGKVTQVNVTWSDGESKTFRPGDKDVPQDVKDRMPGVFDVKEPEKKKNKKENQVQPVREEDVEINDRKKGKKKSKNSSNKMNQPPAPKKEKEKKEVKKEINYGVPVKDIKPEDPGALLFTDENESRKQIFSDGKNALGNANWEKIHRSMKGDFKDKDFDLKNKKKCLFGIKK